MYGLIIDLTEADTQIINEFIAFQREHSFKVHNVRDEVFQTHVKDYRELEAYQRLLKRCRY